MWFVSLSLHLLGLFWCCCSTDRPRLGAFGPDPETRRTKGPDSDRVSCAEKGTPFPGTRIGSDLCLKTGGTITPPTRTRCAAGSNKCRPPFSRSNELGYKHFGSERRTPMKTESQRGPMEALAMTESLDPRLSRHVYRNSVWILHPVVDMTRLAEGKHTHMPAGRRPLPSTLHWARCFAEALSKEAFGVDHPYRPK